MSAEVTDPNVHVTADGVATDDLWAVGAGSDGDMSLAPYVLHSDGNGWTVTPDVPMPGDWIEFNALLPLASDDVYMGGSWFAAAGGYEDDDLLVLNKPPGLAAQGGSGTERHVDGMLDAAAIAAFPGSPSGPVTRSTTGWHARCR